MHVGGFGYDNMNARSFSLIALKNKTRKIFTNQVLNIIQSNEMDGIFIQWLYPDFPDVINKCHFLPFVISIFRIPLE